MAVPFKTISPEVGLFNPANICANVLFPLPEGPIIPTRCAPENEADILSKINDGAEVEVLSEVSLDVFGSDPLLFAFAIGILPLEEVSPLGLL